MLESFQQRYLILPSPDQYSKCTDKQRSQSANNLRNLWFKSDIYWSEEACSEFKEPKNLGNELFIPGIKILSQGLDSNLGGQGFETERAEQCQTECHFRTGICGAWSFDASKKICYLHSTNSCCDQFGKREENYTFMSGYICPHCWSTRNQCPCSEEERQKGINVQKISGGSYTAQTSATVSIQDQNFE